MNTSHESKTDLLPTDLKPINTPKDHVFVAKQSQIDLFSELDAHIRSGGRIIVLGPQCVFSQGLRHHYNKSVGIDISERFLPYQGRKALSGRSKNLVLDKSKRVLFGGAMDPKNLRFIKANQIKVVVAKASDNFLRAVYKGQFGKGYVERDQLYKLGRMTDSDNDKLVLGSLSVVNNAFGKFLQTVKESEEASGGTPSHKEEADELFDDILSGLDDQMEANIVEEEGSALTSCESPAASNESNQISNDEIPSGAGHSGGGGK